MIKLALFSVWILFHPVHVTLTSIDYVKERRALDVFVKLYYDDFLLECSNEGRELKPSGSAGGNDDLRILMEKYLGEKIIIKINDKMVHGKLKDIGVQDNEARVNLEYRDVQKPATIAVENLIMTGLYTDQANMLIIRIGDFEQGVKMTSELREQSFKIK
jgi:hypothetical protein